MGIDDSYTTVHLIKFKKNKIKISILSHLCPAKPVCQRVQKRSYYLPMMAKKSSWEEFSNSSNMGEMKLLARARVHVGKMVKKEGYIAYGTETYYSIYRLIVVFCNNACVFRMSVINQRSFKLKQNSLG